MESDESRPGSSASNSSDSSENSDNSRQSSPTEHPSPGQKSQQSSCEGSSSRKSRSRTRSQSKSVSRSKSASRSKSPSRSKSESRSKSPSHSKSPSRSKSKSSSSSSENEEANRSSPKKDCVETQVSNDNEGSVSSRSSSNVSSSNRAGNVSRNQSISPVRKSRSSRNSSNSSVVSRESNINGEADDENKESALNMSHEDLSDVSDMEIERNEKREEVRNSRDSEDEEQIKEQPSERNGESDHDEEEDDRQENENNKEVDEEAAITDLRQKLDQKKNQLKAMENKDKNGDTQTIAKSNGSVSEELDDLVKKHDEDALDFEAEEGECQDVSKEEEKLEKELYEKEKEKKDSDGEVEEGEELEEGEVSDEEDKRPEETEPKPVCRFYTRGQCTWGMSCRFLHPGVTDKGNYTMFDMVRPVPVPHTGGFGGAHNFHDYRNERPPLHHRPPIHHHPAYVAAHHEARVLPPVVVADTPVPMVESAWERGLRTAKEMMRKANKRKEQDMDFEDKKMNLSLSQDELEKDNFYIRDRASPPDVSPAFPGRHPAPAAVAPHFEPGIYSPPAKFGRGPPLMYDEDPYGRTARYRELPPHRMPHYEDDRRVRPAREVIVQRVEPIGRGDEWNDPWMRSKSPSSRAVGPEGRERPDKRLRRDRRSYSSNSSYSSSSTSRSGSSSESSRSPSPETRRRRYNSTHSSHKSPTRRHIKAMRSPSPRRRRSPNKEYQDKIQMPPPTNVPLIIQRNKKVPIPEIKSSKGIRRSPIKKRGRVSPSPILEKRLVLSPVSKRKKMSPMSRKASTDKVRKRRRGGSSSSGSGSSESSGSESESSYSSSSDSSSRGNTPIKRARTEKSTGDRKVVKKVEMKKRSPISIEIKKPVSNITPVSLDNNSSSSAAASKKTTRREELLKQLRAVEEAIAKKRSKLN